MVSPYLNQPLRTESEATKDRALAAVAEVIHATGFHAMAQEFVAKPEYRPRIRRIIAREITRTLGAEQARQFDTLAQHALGEVGP